MRCFLDIEFISPSNDDTSIKTCLSIGAVCVDKHFKQIKTFYQVILPPFEVQNRMRFELVSKDQLTQPFEKVYHDFKEWTIENNVHQFCTFGKTDLLIFGEDCERSGLENFIKPHLDYQLFIINHWYKKRGEEWRDTHPSLSWLKRLLGSHYPFITHHALEDAYDLMLIAKSFETGLPFEENPFHMSQDERWLQSKRRASVHDFGDLTHYCEIRTKYGLKTSHETAKKTSSITKNEMMYQAVFLKKKEHLFLFEYFDENNDLILKGESHFIDGEWQHFLFNLSEKSSFIVEEKILCLHLRIRQEYLKTFSTKHWLTFERPLYFRVTHKQNPSYQPLPVIFNQGWGFVDTLWDQQELIGYRISIMNLNLDKELKYYEFKFNPSKESLTDFNLHLYQLIEKYPYVKFYSLNYESFFSYLNQIHAFTNRPRNLSAMLKKRMTQLGFSFLDEKEALDYFFHLLHLNTDLTSENIGTLEKMIHFYRWERKIVPHKNIHPLLKSKKIKIKKLTLKH